MESENNFALRFANSGRGPLLFTCLCCSVLLSVDTTMQLSCLVGQGRSDPTNFFGRLKAQIVGPPSPPDRLCGRGKVNLHRREWSNSRRRSFSAWITAKERAEEYCKLDVSYLLRSPCSW